MTGADLADQSNGSAGHSPGEHPPTRLKAGGIVARGLKGRKANNRWQSEEKNSLYSAKKFDNKQKSFRRFNC
jgi:hypothetical protein